ncbi:aminotransferase class I/II-fold pyridoxal phosphate-dependent enzyme [Flavobacteriaceae bacterium S356]|uniref:Aminotransferase class I/II-fold pyridoxal phosphate-dependent enzyme n=1 Tax=Asprobacillus argus TaxID=3076534 RepID=A0ABU3LFK4_9FLAO|nr:aminotransferase class I/II-fold pyridoxal phosphate-dependent enzyme [Flavobacteriaceae bacterium S356]
MKHSKKMGINTICTHVGEIKDEQFKGAVSPIYLSSSYAFDSVDIKRYPRYFNTPNQEALCRKIAALEKTEDALIFGSGMAAVSTTLLAFLHKGDHIILQKSLYGGTYNFIMEECDKFGIEYSFTKGLDVNDFESLIQENTKVLYIETPSNPLLTITDMQAISDLARSKGLTSIIDNTFASPINQNPVDFGIDIMIHSATKYMGGHSDILAGAVAGSKQDVLRIWNIAKNLGGSLSDFTVWMLERSLKTLNLRVKEQCKNALIMAKYLEANVDIEHVYYPGLEDHSDHELAKKQMRGFGGVVSFELKDGIDAMEFQNNLELIKPSMSLAGIESTMLSPTKTSHALLSPEERENQGIKDSLIRFSVGIEEPEDLMYDIEQAIKKTVKALV